MEQDKNGDGKLSKDELPERMQRILERADADKDGYATKEEITKMASSSGGEGGRGFGGEGGRGFGGEGGRGGERGFGEGGRGGRGGEGGRPGEGGRGGEGGRIAMFGPMSNPVAFVERLFELDKDKDGKLSRDELSKFGELFRGAEGAPGEGRREEGRREDGRPSR